MKTTRNQKQIHPAMTSNEYQISIERTYSTDTETVTCNKLMIGQLH